MFCIIIIDIVAPVQTIVVALLASITDLRIKELVSICKGASINYVGKILLIFDPLPLRT